MLADLSDHRVSFLDICLQHLILHLLSWFLSFHHSTFNQYSDSPPEIEKLAEAHGQKFAKSTLPWLIDSCPSVFFQNSLYRIEVQHHILGNLLDSNVLFLARMLTPNNLRLNLDIKATIAALCKSRLRKDLLCAEWRIREGGVIWHWSCLGLLTKLSNNLVEVTDQIKHLHLSTELLWLSALENLDLLPLLLSDYNPLEHYLVETEGKPAVMC